MNSKDVKIIAASEWKPAQGGTVKHRVVIWEHQARPDGRMRYASHMECDLENGTGPYFHEGHYAMGLGEAVLDFETRCNRSKIPPFPVVDGSIERDSDGFHGVRDEGLSEGS